MTLLEHTTPVEGPAPSPRVLSVAPLTLPAPGRGLDLQLRVTVPEEGGHLPVVLFAHGFGSSMNAYGPLADHWAAAGLAVVQPTFLDSRTVGLTPDDPRWPRLWRHRVEDLERVLDGLDRLQEASPTLHGRLDGTRVAVAGHSFGGQSAGILMGLRVTAPDGTAGEDLRDPRVQAGVLLATAGEGGDNLTPEAASTFPWLNPDFSRMSTPGLVVYGDADVNAFLTTRGADWSAEPYRLAPGPEALLVVRGAEHSLGGIPGYDAAETTDADPDRLAAVQRLTTAYLRTRLLGDESWSRARGALDPAVGRVEVR